MANKEDKVTEDAKNYRVGLLKGFGMDEESSAGNRAMKLYEKGMREYLANPIEPYTRRYETMLKRLKKTDATSQEIARAEFCAAELKWYMSFVTSYRDQLTEVAEKYGIKVKKGIVL